MCEMNNGAPGCGCDNESSLAIQSSPSFCDFDLDLPIAGNVSFSLIDIEPLCVE